MQSRGRDITAQVNSVNTILRLGKEVSEEHRNPHKELIFKMKPEV